jgi:hypothetical protein
MRASTPDLHTVTAKDAAFIAACSKALKKNAKPLAATEQKPSAAEVAVGSATHIEGSELQDKSLLPKDKPFIPNEEQATVVDRMKHRMQEFKERKLAGEKIEKPVCEIIFGGPGSGKSTIIAHLNELSKLEGLKTLTIAPMAAVANRLNGRTMHGLSGLGIDSKDWDKGLSLQKADELRAKLDIVDLENDDYWAIIVDEISAVSDLLLYSTIKNIQTLFRSSLPFAGKVLILVGDLFQLPPAGGKNNSLVDAVVKKFVDRSTRLSRAETFVADLLVSSRITNLMLNERAKDDPSLAALIANLRTTDPCSFPMQEHFLPVFDDFVLKKQEVENTPEWKTAPILTAGNRERASFIFTRALAIAKTLGVPLVRWRVKISAKSLATIAPDQVEEMFENDFRLWNFYIQGSSGYIRKNTNVNREVSNGTPFIYYSLTLPESDGRKSRKHADMNDNDSDDDDDSENSISDDDEFDGGSSLKKLQTDAVRLMQAKPGDDIVLRRPPLSVNAHLVDRVPSDFSDCTVVPGLAVIPLVVQTEYLKCFVPEQGMLTLSVKDHNCDLASSATFYKAQGRTMEFALACLSISPCRLLEMTFCALFVWLSRTRFAKNCRALPLLAGETLDHLKDLRVPENLVVFMNGFA